MNTSVVLLVINDKILDIDNVVSITLHFYHSVLSVYQQ